MKTGLQKSDGRTHAVPGVRVRSRWLQFLVVLLLLTANAGVVNANDYWRNFRDNHPDNGMLNLIRSRTGNYSLQWDQLVSINGRVLTIHLLTLDNVGADSYIGVEGMRVYMSDQGSVNLNEQLIFETGVSSNNIRNGVDERWGTNHKFPIADMQPQVDKWTWDNKYQRFMLTLKFRIPDRYWGEKSVRFEGTFNQPNDKLNFTKVANPNLSTTPYFTYGNKPTVVEAVRIAPNKVRIKFDKLPNVRMAKNEIKLPNGVIVETKPGTTNGDNFPATVQHEYIENSNPGIQNTLSGMQSIISYQGKTATGNIDNYPLKKLPTIENLKLTYNQNTKNVVLDWFVNNSNAQTSSIDRVAILRKLKGDPSWSRIGTVNISSITNGTYTDTGISFDKEYDYAVVYYQYSTDWLGASLSLPTALHPSGITGLHATNSINTTTIHDINLTGSFDLNDGAVLNWNSDKSSIFSPSSFQILKNGTLIATISYDVTKDSYQYKDASIKGTSTTYKYQIRHVVNNTKLIKNFLSNEVNVTAVQSAKITKTIASKGEYPGIVKLSWDVKNYPVSGVTPRTQYIISRRSLESADNVFAEMYRTSSTEDFLTWTDDRVLPGIYYEYKFKWIANVNNTDIPDSTTNVGFAQSSGNISGRISYGTGTAVEGVSVILKPTNTENDITASRSLRFLGTGSYAKWDLENQTKASALFNSANFSIQMWVRPENTTSANNSLLNINKYMRLGLNKLVNSEHMLQLITSSGTTDLGKLYTNKYSHVSLVRIGTSLKVYIQNYDENNNVSTDSRTVTIPSGLYSSSVAGNFELTIGAAYTGYVDEFRLWNKALTETEIQKNFDRLIAGNDTGLQAYWRFDEGLKSMFFDASRKGSVLNSNHGVIIGTSTHSTTIIPSDQQLALKAITDKDGNYLVSGIPFGGEGTSYSVTPLMGIHKFQPSQSLRFIGASALVHNGTDFTDISSFPVTGKITFANGEFPVEGVQISIDGIAASRNGKLIQTDVNGNYTVDVPIGDHFISVSKPGHTFANNGRYPATENTFHTFVQPVSGLEFQDKTLVKLAGRVSGGEREGNKPVGFGLSKANLGKATVVLNPVDDRHRLNTTAAVLFADGDIDAINSKTTLPFEKTGQIVIETDENTGEFLTMLPPIEYKVVDIYTLDVDSVQVLTKDDFKVDAIAQFTPDVNKVEKDSAVIDGVSKEFEYNRKLNVNYRVDPDFEVTNAITRNAAFGDSIYNYTKSNGSKETIKLFTVANGQPTYTLGHPVFTKMNTYAWRIYGYEKYINAQTAAEDLVPLKDAEVQIDNALASTTVFVEQNDSLHHEPGMLKLNESGVGIYQFHAGFPNMSNDHLLAAKFTYDHLGKIITWPATGEFKGYVFGDIPVPGTNFVTQGPDVVDYILRDPSGSNSASYLEKGSIISNTVKLGVGLSSSSGYDLEMSLGSDQQVATGFGVAVILRTLAESNTTLSFAKSSVKTMVNTTVNTTEVLQRISTSTSDEYVGTMADVYIGQSTNLLFGKTNKLGLFPTESTGVAQSSAGNNFALNNKEVLSTGADFTTTFNYTQNHIIEYLIPNIIALRNALILPGNDSIGYVNNDTAAVYFSRVPVGDERFGQPNTYKILQPAVNTGKPVVDRISIYNSWINSWEKSIAENEKAKIESFKNTPTRNLSFDAGTTIDQSINQIVTKTHEMTSNNEITVGMGSVEGFEFAGVGFSLSKSSSYTGSLDQDTGEEKTESRMFGFTLADPNQGDYYTIDVYDPVDNNGYIFKTRGGQSACPYEGPEYAMYYEPEKQHVLSAGTFQVEKPAILINNTKNASAENISNGREASFDIQLSNQSEANLAVSYLLGVKDGTNSDGLILSIDGSPLTTPRIYTIPAGASITKSLKVRQSSLDVLDYNNITLLFTSTCQIDPTTGMGWIADSARVNVKFVPSSSPLTLKLPTTLINKENGSPKVTYQVSDYERNFKNFASIRLQYKEENSQNWSLAREFVNNTTLVPLTADNSEITGATFSYDFDVKNLPDGRYDVRAIAVSKIGTDEITTTTPVQKVIKDMVSPQVLGEPAPVTDILTPEDEISVMFNEDILSNYITQNFITVKGVLNGHKIDHNVAGKFDGTAAYTEASVALADNSFTIEGWLKRTPDEAGTFIAHDNLQIGFTTDNKLAVKIGNESFTSTKTLPTANWQYLSFAYNNDTRSFSAYGLYEAVSETLFSGQQVSSTYQGTGRLYVGANADNSNLFNGSVHNLALWNTTRTLTDLSDRDNAKVGNEKGLIGYWNLNEGHGTIAADIARSRQLTMPSTNNWYLNNVNHALNLDGTNSVQIPAGTIPITENENFAVELWFNGTDQANATLISAGDGILDLNNTGKLSIGFNADKKLTLRSKGGNFELSKNNYLDGKWHHFVLNVVRGGYASVYVNGNLEKQITASNIGSVENGEISLGSNKYATQGASGVETKNENFFKGKLDEVRIWKSTMSSSMFNLNRYNRLVGNETGLAAYYPFEHTSVNDFNQNETKSTLKGFTQGVASVGTSTATSTFEKVNVPPLKEARVTENVSHTFTVSKDKVVINITEPTYRIEGRTLEMKLTRVSDLNGNVIAPVNWTAYINLNRLNWSDNQVNVTQEHMSSKTVEVTISNQSGKEENWAISNIPAWLRVSKTQGTLKPLSSEKLVLTFLTSAPIGSYEENIYLTGNNQIDEPLAVSLKVTGTKPNWTFNPNDFETSMNVVGSLKVDGQLSEDTEDILAAFIDDQCVGIASPVYVKNLNTYLVMLNIYGNDNTNGKQVEFKVWDASTGKTYPIVSASETIVSSNDAIYGGLFNPVIFDAANLVEQNIALGQGWNWVSFNVEHVDMSLQNIFSKAKSQTELVKNKTSMAVPSATGWAGVIDSVHIGEMYKVKNSSSAQLSYVGKAVNPSEFGIDLVTGWNWIGFTPQSTMPVAIALADVNPSSGDVIKSKSTFSIYSGTEWIGNLQYLTPGTGYMYQATTGKKFHYPTNYISRVPMRITGNYNFNYTPNNNSYYGNMNIIAQVKYEDGSIASDVELAAFVGNECRGTEITRQDNLVFLTLAGEDGRNDIISFKVFENQSNREVIAQNTTVKYVNDALIGSLDNPFVINISKATTALTDAAIAGISVTPTLVNDKLFVKSDNAELKRIIIADINGKVVYKDEQPQLYNEIMVNTLLSGVYFVEIITTDNARKVERIVKK